MLTTVVGVALLLLLAADVFGTVFGGGGGFLHNVQNAAIWMVLRRLARRVHGRWRDRLLNLGGPLLAILTLTTWGLLLVTGFALLYAPHVLGMSYAAVPPTSRWAEAFYVSAILTSTLGLGDVIATTPELRLLMGFQGLLGFAFLTTSIAYVLNVYRHRTNARALASLIDAYLERGATAALAGAGRADVLRWGENVAEELLRVLQGHYEYPVLHYFRAREPESALPLQVGRLLDLLDEMGPANGPSHHLLARAVDRYVRRSARGFAPPWFGGAGVDEDMDLREAYARLLAFHVHDVT